MTAKERFLSYVKIDTTSNAKSDTYPSTQNQLVLLKMLKDELVELGVNAEMDEFGIVSAVIPSNGGKGNVGFIAHVDTSDAVSGKDIKPQCFIYEGGDIVLKGGSVIKMQDTEFLGDCIGEEIITSDGTTLLGADDKAGVAEIMTAVENIVSDKNFIHGDIRIAFTPDEEIGRGTDHFNVEKFGAKVAYTIDGGTLGEISYENFNACSLTVKVNGVSTHPGSGKGKMKNAIDMFSEFHSYFPESERPFSTEGYQGFYMANGIKGTSDNLSASYIIRDHDREKFEKRKEFVRKVEAKLNKKYGENSFVCTLTDSYYNMKEVMEKNMDVVENAFKAFVKCGVKPYYKPVRGGTDGARLSFMGLPCPNLSTGENGCHGKGEVISVKALETMPKVIKSIIALYSE